MAGKMIKIWYDPEADYLEVSFEHKKGYFRETAHDAVMEEVDANGKVIGFSILGVTTLGPHPIELTFAGKKAAASL